MSSGGSNYSTGATGGGNQVSVDAPASNPASYTNAPAPAPGGKGGFPSAQSPYAQQQPQMYMPPQQPSMYQQAFPQQYGGYNNFGNAYARRMPMYSPQTPIEASPPPSEMNYAPGGYDSPPQELMSDSWRRRPRLEPTAPVEATRGVISESNYSGGLGSLISGVSRQGPEPLIGMRDPRINLSPNAFGAPAQPLDWINTPNGRLWNA